MSLSKFRVVRTQQTFFYDNETNGLLNDQLEQLSSPYSPSATLPVSTLAKSRSPNTLKISLGQGCNYSCGYCLQKDIGDRKERPQNEQTAQLLERLGKQLDVDSIQRLELWGGETLLYWGDIVAIMSRLDRPGLTWYIPTNGTLLSEKHVSFFSGLKGKVTVGISHDGPAHESTRGREFLPKKNAVLRLMQEAKIPFSFNCVISSSNHDLFAVDDYFSRYLFTANLNPVPIVYELGRVYDSTLTKNSYKHVITGDQLPIYRQNLRRYLQRHTEELKSGQQKLLKTSLFHFGNGVLPYATTLKSQMPISVRTNCGVDLADLLSIDLAGKVRTCQNTSNAYSHGDISNIEDVRLSGVSLDKGGFCKNCSVLRLCKSSCPIELPHEVFLINHAVERVHYGEMQLAAFSLLFGSEVEHCPEDTQAP